MDQEAIVARVEGDQAYVEVGGAGAGCGRCHEAGGCQSSILGQLFRAKPQQYRIPNPMGAVPGDPVVLRAASGASLRAAFLVYVLPVLFLLLGAAAGSAFDLNGNIDLSTALGSLLGLALGIIFSVIARRRPVGKVDGPILLRRSSTFCISKDARQ